MTPRAAHNSACTEHQTELSGVAHLRARSETAFVPKKQLRLNKHPKEQNNVVAHRPAKHKGVRTLLIDNYDSYTYNLFQLLADVNRVAPTVVKNDELSWRDLAQQLSRGKFDNVVISPGPGTPAKSTDAGVCNLLLEEAEDVPILGVCFGMQALAHVHGGQVVAAPEPIHGRLSEITHNGHALFESIPTGRGGGFEVVRYHSLAVDEASLPSCLEPIAWTTGAHHAVSLQQSQAEVQFANSAAAVSDANVRGLLMGIAHASRPHFGVQFHPESVATAHGADILRNFKAATCRHRSATGLTPGNNGAQRPHLNDPVPKRSTATSSQQLAPNLDVKWRVCRGALDEFGGVEKVFWQLFGSHGASCTFWLDSSSHQGQRFSYMGGRGGPLWRQIAFKLAAPQPGSVSGAAESPKQPLGTVSVESEAGEVVSKQTHFFDFLQQQLEQWRCSGGAEGLPFDFTGGFVGYLGYELKTECGAPGPHVSPHPDAAMFLADRLLVVDHHTNDVFLVAMHQIDAVDSVLAAEEWLKATHQQLEGLRMPSQEEEAVENDDALVNSRRMSCQEASTSDKSRAGARWEESLSADGGLEARRSKSGYKADIARCLHALRLGDSYELCLTTQLRRKAAVDARKLYSDLRGSNPSAHAAWLSFGGGLPTICCSSPERFLRGTRGGVVEARPIKGTTARSEDPAVDAWRKAALVSCEKSRAENLMIVDLLRNDLGRFCQVGSVHASKLMEVETYATVHNLVSTVKGVREEGCSIVDCIRAAFPGGSMTGAPKLRSMQILDSLENGPRGVYSGSLGFIGLNDTFDLNIVIRTAVVTGEDVTVGAGGAIVLQSDPESEYEEMQLKARALLRAIERCVE